MALRVIDVHVTVQLSVNCPEILQKSALRFEISNERPPTTTRKMLCHLLKKWSWKRALSAGFGRRNGWRQIQALKDEIAAVARAAVLKERHTHFSGPAQT
jgi:hypothetical protein